MSLNGLLETFTSSPLYSSLTLSKGRRQGQGKKKIGERLTYAHILFLKVIFNSKKIYVYGCFALTDVLLYACQVPTEGRRRLQIHWKWS